VPLKIVSEILGHAGIQITADTYGHVLPESKRKAIEKMEQLFQRKEGT
jgi:integrase